MQHMSVDMKSELWTMNEKWFYGIRKCVSNPRCVEWKLKLKCIPSPVFSQSNTDFSKFSLKINCLLLLLLFLLLIGKRINNKLINHKKKHAKLMLNEINKCNRKKQSISIETIFGNRNEMRKSAFVEIDLSAHV